MTAHPLPESADLVVVGAGIVGLAHAIAARRNGFRVVVLERDTHAVGASIRNFGHICTTAQTGQALTYARVAREHWLRLARDADLPVRQSGTLVVARDRDELGVLEEFAAERGPHEVQLVDRAQVIARIGSVDEATVGGAFLPLDLRTDPRVALPGLAAYAESIGITVQFQTNVLTIEDGAVRTNRGSVDAHLVVVCVGHDLDRLYPDTAASVDLQRCALHMLQVRSPGARAIEPAILTGLSMLRYGAMAAQPSIAAVRSRIEREHPELLQVVMNLMLTQRPDGDLVIGDTHADALTHDPFAAEATSNLVLSQTAQLLAVDSLEVTERWRGFYAHSNTTDFVDATISERVRAVTVASGIGMTTAFGLAQAVIDSAGDSLQPR